LAVLGRVKPALRALFWTQNVGPADAEDIVQEALVVLVKRWAGVDDPAGFLMGTVKKRLQNHFRRRRSDRSVPLAAADLERAGAGPPPQRQVECRQDARKLLARLPERSSQIVGMRYGEELSPREIAQEQGGSESGVRKTANRGLRRLRHLVKAGRSGA
jgi:RNA polymerase sigma factor (sigma-70 family)